jgi:hypothetical protein
MVRFLPGAARASFRGPRRRGRLITGEGTRSPAPRQRYPGASPTELPTVGPPLRYCGFLGFRGAKLPRPARARDRSGIKTRRVFVRADSPVPGAERRGCAQKNSTPVRRIFCTRGTLPETAQRDAADLSRRRGDPGPPQAGNLPRSAAGGFPVSAWCTFAVQYARKRSSIFLSSRRPR